MRHVIITALLCVVVRAFGQTDSVANSYVYSDRLIAGVHGGLLGAIVDPNFDLQVPGGLAYNPVGIEFIYD